MAISTDYSVPVYVNGYACKNCAQVAEAKQHIDPAHPDAGPFGVNARNDPTLDAAAPASTTQSPAVRFGGALTGTTTTSSGASPIQTPWAATAVGGQVNLSA